MLPLDDLIIEVLQQVLVVTDAVTHRLVGAPHVQHRAQRLIHHIDDVEGTGVFVQIHIQLLVLAHLLTAVFMQQLVAVLQGAACQQQAALLLVVVDVGFYRSGIKAPLCRGKLREEDGQQHRQQQGSTIVCCMRFTHLHALSHSVSSPPFSSSLSSPFGSAFSLHRS